MRPASQKPSAQAPQWTYGNCDVRQSADGSAVLLLTAKASMTRWVGADGAACRLQGLARDPDVHVCDTKGVSKCAKAGMGVVAAGSPLAISERAGAKGIVPKSALQLPRQT
jgi:hypothetical protein